MMRIYAAIFVVLLVCGPALTADPAADTSSTVEGFDYFANNWNIVGLKDYIHGSRITPDNELLLSGKTPVQVRIGLNRTPLSRAHGKQAMHGWMPVILADAVEGPVRYEICYWATPLPDVRDWQKAFDWPTEGENFLTWIRVRATNTSGEQVEAHVEVGPNADGNRPSRFVEQQAEPKIEHKHTRTYTWSWPLQAGETAEEVARYTFFPVEDAKAYDGQDAEVWLGRTVNYWKNVMAGAAKIEVPCRKASEALLAAHVCQLIANDHGEMHGGEGFYDHFYIRDAGYQVMELEEAGLTEAARRAMEAYLKSQRPDGRFESQSGQLDANGQAVWVLWQFYKVTGDKDFLAAAYPRMRKAVDWTMKARRQAPADSQFAGVLPNAVADGEYLWDGKYHIVGYDLWNLRGMLCTADAARALGKSEEADKLLGEANLYRRAIDAACRRIGATHFPPSWEGRGTHWGNTETLWPTPVFRPDDPRVAAMIEHARSEHGGGFIEGTIQWLGRPDAIHPYMSAYTTMADLVRGNHEQVVEDFYWYLLHSTAAHAFPEGIYYKRRTAWSHTIPHVTGASNYALMLRHMLIHEAGDELHVLRAVPDWWLGDGEEIRVERLPTHFGLMNLTVRGTPKGVEVNLDAPKRNPPKRIVVSLPKSRPIAGTLDGVEVVQRSDQQQRWDFPTVLALYKKTADWLKPDAVSLTTGKPATCSHALSPYPARLANDGFAGSTDSYWATDIVKHKANAAWWQVDLEKPTMVGRVVVVGFYGDKRYYGFTVETSLDAKTWDVVADRRDNKELSTVKGYTCRFAPRRVRYIRITQTANSANTGRHLVEVMAYKE